MSQEWVGLTPSGSVFQILITRSQKKEALTTVYYVYFNISNYSIIVLDNISFCIYVFW